MKYWHLWRYKNLTILTISIVFALSLSRNQAFTTFLLNLGQLGYIGAFIGGMLFTISFTLAIGAVILATLAEKLSPLEIGLVAGLGAVVGDLTIFRFVRDNLAEELTSLTKPLSKHFGQGHLFHLLQTKYFSWTLPVIGALIIASPLPDEIGVSLMGIAKMKTYKFAIISYILNSVGIFLIISASLLIK